MILRSPTDNENHDITVSSLIPFPLTGKGQDRCAPEQIKTSPLPSSFPIEGKESDIDASLLHHTIFEGAHEEIISLAKHVLRRRGVQGKEDFELKLWNHWIYWNDWNPVKKSTLPLNLGL